MRPLEGFRRSLSMCAAFALAILVTAAAAADGVAPGVATPEQKKEAMDHFVAGKQAFEARNLERAILELRASLDIVDSPNVRLELARALRDSGALGDAWTEFGQVVDDATKLAATEERYAKTADVATSERTEVEAKVSFLVVTVVNAPPDAVLKVGGRVVPHDQWTTPIIALPGAVDVVLADATGKELARKTVAAIGGQQGSVTLDAQPPPVPVPVAPIADDKPDFSEATASSPDSPSSHRANLRPYAYVAGGVGVVGFGLFAAFGAMSNSDYNDLQSLCIKGHCPAGKASEISDGKTYQTLANLGLGVGIAGVAAGATLFVLSLTGKPDTTGLVVGPGYIGLRGSL
jgi:hypothetical protein